MRDWLFVIVLLAVVAGAAWMVLPRLGVQVGPASPQVTVTAPVASAPASPPPAKSPPKRSKAVARVPEAVPESTATVTAPAVDQDRATALPPPTALSELKPGLNRAAADRPFGNPDLKATTVNRGSLLETYIYTEKSDGRAIFAALKDGRVQHVREAAP